MLSESTWKRKPVTKDGSLLAQTARTARTVWNVWIAPTVLASSLALLAIGCGNSAHIVVGTTAQAITFNNPGTQTAGTSLTLSATASSGLPVSFLSSTPGTCMVSGSTVSLTAAGTCTIAANVPGNSTYAAASAVTQSFAVNPAIPPNSTVYIVGNTLVPSSSSISASTNSAVLWQLASGSPAATAKILPAPGGTTGAVANAVAASGSDVYVAGFALTASSDIPVYWLNGSPIVLPSNGTLARAYSIAVSGGNVYIAGFEANSANDSTAILWLNGAATPLPLPSGLTDGFARAVTVSGGNVYVAGSASSNTTGNTAVLWVNGVPTQLPMPSGMTGDYYASGVGVVGSNVYVSGYMHYGGDGSETAALLWQNNGPATLLPVPASIQPDQYGASQITVSGNDVFVAGFGSASVGSSSAVYWLNDAPVTLPVPNYLQATPPSSSAQQIALLGNDVYAAGNFFGSSEAETNLQAAAYWVDGGPVTLLPMPTGTYEAYASGIAVATQ